MLSNSKLRSFMCVIHRSRSRQRSAILQIVGPTSTSAFWRTSSAAFFSLESLESISREVLVQSENNENYVKDLEDLLERWDQQLGGESVAKGSSATTENLRAAVDRMHDIFGEWVKHEPRQKNASSLAILRETRTNRPFQIMLKAYSQYAPNGVQSLNVIETWNDVFSGDIELSPRREDYEAVLQAFCSQQLSNDEIFDPISAGEIACELVDQLNQWGYGMKPGIRTHQLAIQCVTGAIRHIFATQIQETTAYLVAILKGTLKESAETLMVTPAATTLEDIPLIVIGLSDALQCAPFFDDETWTAWYQRWHTLVVHHKDLLAPHVNENPGRFHDLVSAIQNAASSIQQDSLRENLVADPIKVLESFNNDDALSHLQYFTAIRQQSDTVLADSLLQKLEERHERLKSVASTLDWNILMKTNTGTQRTSRALNIWREMGEYITKDEYSFAIALMTYAEKGSPIAAESAYDIMRAAMGLHPGHRLFNPKGIHFSWAMKACVNSGHPNAWEYCSDLFEWLLQVAEENGDDPECKPVGQHYSMLVLMLGKSGHPTATDKIMALIERMKRERIMEKDPLVKKILVSALCLTKSIKGIMRAQVYLYELVSSPDESPDSLISRFNDVIGGWAFSGAEDAPERCQAIASQLNDLYRAVGRNPPLEQAAEVSQSMIHAWANCKRINSGEEAEKELESIEAAAAAGSCSPPDLKSYTTVMAAYWSASKQWEWTDATKMKIRSDCYYNIRRIYDKMVESYEKGNAPARPDAFAVTVVLRACAMSAVPNKHKIAWGLLHGMIESYLKKGSLDMKPTHFAFNYVLMSCVSCTGDATDDAVNTALLALNAMQRACVTPDEYSFEHAFKVVHTHITDDTERYHMATLIFQQCCQEGFVGDIVLRHMQTYFPRLYANLPVKSETAELQLPNAWTRKTQKPKSYSSPKRHGRKY